MSSPTRAEIVRDWRSAIRYVFTYETHDPHFAPIARCRAPTARRGGGPDTHRTRRAGAPFGAPEREGQGPEGRSSLLRPGTLPARPQRTRHIPRTHPQAPGPSNLM